MMDPARLKKTAESPGPVPKFLEEKEQPEPEREQEREQKREQSKGQEFDGLDPLTRSLVEAAPIVRDRKKVTVRKKIEKTEKDKIEREKTEKEISKPHIFIAAGGLVAAGLLLFLGVGRGRGEQLPPTPAAPPVPTPATNTGNIAINTANDSWTVAGGN